MNKDIYMIEVISKLSHRHACTFYVKAYTIADAAVYAMNYLVPDALEATMIIKVADRNEVKDCDIYEAD